MQFGILFIYQMHAPHGMNPFHILCDENTDCLLCVIVVLLCVHMRVCSCVCVCVRSWPRPLSFAEASTSFLLVESPRDFS